MVQIMSGFGAGLVLDVALARWSEQNREIRRLRITQPNNTKLETYRNEENQQNLRHRVESLQICVKPF